MNTGGKTYNGTARLEQKELTFRGDNIRLTIPLAEIRDVSVRDGSLFVSSTTSRASFELGPSAEKWARRITNPPSRLQKLGIKPGMRVGVQNVEDQQLVQDIETGGAVLERDPRANDLDIIFFGARSANDLDRLGPVVNRIKPSGAIWLLRAKGPAAPVSEAASMAAGKRAGLVDVKVVSFSDAMSAEKYVIPVEKRGAHRPTRSPSPRSGESASSRVRR